MSLQKLSEIAYYILFGLIWARTILMDYLGGMLLHVIGAPAKDLLISLIYLIPLFFSMLYLKRQIKIVDVLFYLAIVIVFVLQYVLFPENHDKLDECAPFFMVWTLPMFIVGLGYNSRVLFKVLTYISFVSIICLAFYKLVLNVGYMEQKEISEDMAAAYNLLPHLLLIISVALKQRKLLFIILALFGTFLLFSFGTRGPLVCVVVFFLIYFLLSKDRKVGSRVFILSFGVLALLTINFWQEWALSIFDHFGMSNRILNKIDGGVLFESSSRDSIRRTLLSYVSSGPLWGFGLCGDRVLVGTYSHNLLLELVVSFGLIIGILLFLYLTIVLIRGGKSTLLWENKVIWLVLFCSSYVHLMISGSFLNETLLFLLIGISISNKRINSFARSEEIW